ncbi:MAG: hypothetical protein HYR85_18550 [Planctomycetes bacterium]|nr:hypothetical protein [Planctomycetota bacterium]MBI3843382.1 hypothetical protein [Planctomycetota bacterium]
MNSITTRLERLSIVIAALALACSSRAAAQDPWDALDPQPEAPIRYVLEVSGGLPHFDEVIVVEEEGRVILSFQDWNGARTIEDRVEARKMSLLAILVEAAHFDTLPSVYDDPVPAANGVEYRTTVLHGGLRHSVESFTGSVVPEAFGLARTQLWEIGRDVLERVVLETTESTIGSSQSFLLKVRASGNWEYWSQSAAAGSPFTVNRGSFRPAAMESLRAAMSASHFFELPATYPSLDVVGSSVYATTYCSRGACATVQFASTTPSVPTVLLRVRAGMTRLRNRFAH